MDTEKLDFDDLMHLVIVKDLQQRLESLEQIIYAKHIYIKESETNTIPTNKHKFVNFDAIPEITSTDPIDISKLC
jgi:hypothetical protein